MATLSEYRESEEKNWVIFTVCLKIYVRKLWRCDKNSKIYVELFTLENYVCCADYGLNYIENGYMGKCMAMPLLCGDNLNFYRIFQSPQDGAWVKKFVVYVWLLWKQKVDSLFQKGRVNLDFFEEIYSENRKLE